MTRYSHHEFEIKCYPKSAIPRRVGGFVMSDVFSDMVNMGRGDAQPLSIEGAAFESSQWQTSDNQSLFSLVEHDKVEFIRFGADGRVREGASSGQTNDAKKQEVAGWIIQGREAPLDNKIGTTTLDTPDITDLNWTAASGTWNTVRPPEPPLRCWVMNRGSTVTTVQAKTTGDIPARRSFRFDTYLTLNRKHSGKTPPWQRISWGGYLYSVFLQHGQKPQIHKFANGKWNLIRRLEGAKVTRFDGGRLTLRVRLLGGRLVVGIDGAHFHVLESSTQSGTSRPVDSAWPAGKVVVEVNGAHARFNLSTIKYSEASGALFKGKFKRLIAQATNQATEDGTLNGFGKGWNKDGTTVTIAGDQGAAYQSNSASYVATLTASPDGIDTPFLTGASIEYAPSWLTHAPAPLDIWDAVESGSISLAMPGVTSCAQATLTVNLQTLHKINPRWKSYIGKYCPISIRQRWHYEGGGVGAWNHIFKGYIVSPSASAEGANRYRATLVCFDPIFRLKDNNARIWTNFAAPMDFVWQRNAATLGSTKLYGWDCVQEIIDKTIGREAGGTVQAVFPPSHYPLLDASMEGGGGWMFVGALAASIGSGQPPTISVPHFPPPFGSDALTWIESTFAEKDKAVFFYGSPTGSAASWPQPVYGRLNDILFGRSVKDLPDEVYSSSDENSFLSSYNVSHKPENDVNEVYVAGSPPPQQLQAFMPALPNTMAYAALPAIDPNSAARTWARTKIIRSDIANLNAPAYDAIPQYLANGFIDDIRDVEMSYPNFTLAFGDGAMMWGDRVRGKVVTSDCKPFNIGVGKTVVVENVEHSFTHEMFETTLRCFPLPNNADGVST